MRLISANSRKRFYKHLICLKCMNICIIKNFYFFLCIYKTVNINKKSIRKNDIEAIVYSIGTLWLNENHIEQKLGHKIYQPSRINMTKSIKRIDVN